MKVERRPAARSLRGRARGREGAPSGATPRRASLTQEEADSLVWTLDIDGLGHWRCEVASGRLWASDALKALFGLAPDEPLESLEAIEARFHPEDRARVAEMRDRAVAAVGQFEDEHRIVTATGDVRWVLVRARASRCPRLGLVLAGVAIDITAQKSVEADRERLVGELAAERARLHALVAHIPAAVLVADAEGRVVLANPTVGAIFPSPLPSLPVAREELFSAWHARHAEGRPVADEERPLSRSLRGEIVEAEEFRYRRPDGTETWIRVASAPIRDERDAIAGAVVIAACVDRERRAENSLRSSERRHRQLFDSPVIGIIHSNIDGTITDANDKFLGTLGYTREELERGALSWRSLTPLEFEEEDDLGVEELRTVGSHRVYEKQYFHKDGSRVPILLGGTMVSGSETEIVTFILDLREQKRAEAERDTARRRQQEFERQLLGIVSHDLRSPLATIRLATDAMLLQGEDIDARVVRNAIRVRSAADRAMRMVRDLLDFTQARLGGGIAVKRRPVDLDMVVRAVVEELRVAHPTRRLVLESTGDARGPFDDDRLSQVVANLIENALKYSPQDSAVQVALDGRDDDVVFSVHNQGPTIPSELRSNIFEPLHRGGVRSDPASRSVGLGLYIVKHLVEGHGGSVHVDSSDDQGTTFTVRLPRASMHGGQRAGADPLPPPRAAVQRR